MRISQKNIFHLFCIFEFSICFFVCACASSSKPSFDELPPPQKPAPKSFTMQDKRLSYILDKQENLAKNIARNSLNESQASAELAALKNLWKEHISRNSDDTTSLIFYGKFLRSCGELDSAYEVFKHVDSLDSKIAVAKQQLATREAEKGEFKASYEHIKSAIELAPNEFAYRYQLAELLRKVGSKMCAQKILSVEEKDAQMLDAYKKSLELESNKDAKINYANAFFEVENPPLKDASKAWDEVIAMFSLPHEKDAARMSKVNLLISIGALDEASATMTQIESPAYIEQKTKAQEYIQTKKNLKK